MAHIDLRHLRAFVTVLQAGTYTKAAAELKVTQPSLSRLVNQLERHFGQRVLVRNRHPLRTTAFGERLLPHARRALAAFDDTLRVESGVGGESIRVGFSWNSAGSLTRRIIETFEQAQPGARVLLRRHNRPLAGLEDGRSHVAWVRTEPEAGAWEWADIYQEDRIAVVSRNHPLADRDLVLLDDLRDESLVLNSISGTTTTELWPDSDHSREVIHVGNTEEWLNEIALGRGIGVGVATTFEFHLHPDVRAIKLGDAAPVNVRLAWPRHNPHPLCSEFVSAARDVVRRS